MLSLIKQRAKSGLNSILRQIGLQLIRVPGKNEIKDPAMKSIARGLSAKEHNSQQNMDAIYADPDIEEYYFTPDRLKFYSHVREKLRALDLQPNKVLDVGCGSGHLLNSIRSLYPLATLRGVDFSAESIRLAQRLHPSIEFSELSIFELEQLGQQFDLVLCTEVLEHLEDADVAIDKLLRQCSYLGVVAITVPNGRTDTFEGHFNFWTPESFLREFRRYSPEVSVFASYLYVIIRKPSIKTADSLEHADPSRQNLDSECAT